MDSSNAAIQGRGEVNTTTDREVSFLETPYLGKLRFIHDIDRSARTCAVVGPRLAGHRVRRGRRAGAARRVGGPRVALDGVGAGHDDGDPAGARRAAHPDRGRRPYADGGAAGTLLGPPGQGGAARTGREGRPAWRDGLDALGRDLAAGRLPPGGGAGPR